MFLQGLLVNDFGFWPVKFKDAPTGTSPKKDGDKADLDLSSEVKGVFDEIENIVADAELNVTKHQLCARYVASQPWIDAIVFGVDHQSQLKENLALFESSREALPDA